MSLKHCNDLKDFINYSNYIVDIYENIDNLSKKCKKLFAFDDMIADMLNTQKLQPTVTELLIRSMKTNISRFLIISFCCAEQYQTELHTTSL